jgi:hypothetical protein
MSWGRCGGTGKRARKIGEEKKARKREEGRRAVGPGGYLGVDSLV